MILNRDSLMPQPYELEEAAQLTVPSFGAYLQAKSEEGFEYTTTKQADVYFRIENDPENNISISREEFEEQYSRPGIEYEEGMTKAKARIYAEEFDTRAYRGMIIDAAQPGFLGQAAGFGAMLFGSLPDPINLIPFGGGIVKGGKLISKAGKAGKGLVLGEDLLSASNRARLAETGVSKGAAAASKPTAKNLLAWGAAEGALGTAAADAIVFPHLQERGEDVGLSDALLDITFGAAIGAALHYPGYRIGRKLEERIAGRSKEIEAARSVTTIADKKQLLAATDLAVADFVEGRSIDVAPVLRDTGTVSKLEYNRLLSSLETGDYTDVSFGKLNEKYKLALNDIRTEEGVALIVNDELTIPANVVRKLHEKRMLQEGMRANEVAEMLLDVFHLETTHAAATKHPHIQALISLRKDLSEIGFIGVHEETGRTIIKSVYKNATKRIWKSLGIDNTTLEGRPTPSSRAGDDPITASGKSRQPGRLTDHQGDVLDKRIIRIGDEVNWTAEAPEAFERAPELSAEARTALEELGIDPKTRMGADEQHLEILRENGFVSDEDLVGLEAARTAESEAEIKERAGLEAIQCIMRNK